MNALSVMRGLGPLAVIGAIGVAGCGAPASVEDEGDSENVSDAPSAIVGGEDSMQRAVIYIDGPDSHFCSGTLVSPTMVLTAGHCVKGEKAEDITIRVVNLFAFTEGGAGEEVVTARRYSTHPKYKKDYGLLERLGFHKDRDFAIVFLTKPVKSAKPARFTRLPEGIEGDCNRVTAVGFGRQTPGPKEVKDTHPSKRKKARQCIVDVDEKMISTKGIDGGTCWGDSGGGLFLNHSNAVVAEHNKGSGECGVHSRGDAVRRSDYFDKWIACAKIESTGRRRACYKKI